MLDYRHNISSSRTGNNWFLLSFIFSLDLWHYFTSIMLDRYFLRYVL